MSALLFAIALFVALVLFAIPVVVNLMEWWGEVVDDAFRYLRNTRIK